MSKERDFSRGIDGGKRRLTEAIERKDEAAIKEARGEEAGFEGGLKRELGSRGKEREGGGGDSEGVIAKDTGDTPGGGAIVEGVEGFEEGRAGERGLGKEAGELIFDKEAGVRRDGGGEMGVTAGAPGDIGEVFSEGLAGLDVDDAPGIRAQEMFGQADGGGFARPGTDDDQEVFHAEMGVGMLKGEVAVHAGAGDSMAGGPMPGITADEIAVAGVQRVPGGGGEGGGREQIGAGGRLVCLRDLFAILPFDQCSVPSCLTGKKE